MASLVGFEQAQMPGTVVENRTYYPTQKLPANARPSPFDHLSSGEPCSK